MERVKIRSGRGLGDALYLQSVVRFLEIQGKEFTVLTDYPEVFGNLRCMTEAFTRSGQPLVAHYTDQKGNDKTKQFEDCYRRVGIEETLDLKINWQIKNYRKIKSYIKLAKGKPLLLVMSARNPMARDDGFGKELLPIKSVYQKVLDQIEPYFKILIGRGVEEYKLENIDLDLTNQTGVEDLLDLAAASQGAIGFCSFMIPLMESFGKPSLAIWTNRSLNSANNFIKTITPTKILYNDNSKYLIDIWPEEKQKAAINDYLHQLRAN
jgi:hypothetical protein